MYVVIQKKIILYDFVRCYNNEEKVHLISYNLILIVHNMVLLERNLV